ncbi:MAG TPA: prepilin-type N-terminal cleavage/methylation domain-containing protein, partial [Bdellovibrionota bacterium]|nr:prepilin-type N-terminal cleavage/methylation domain-containing protein [Bdellovibrionota bacterium]
MSGGTSLSQRRLDDSGVTLMELMVSVALFGISALAMANMFAHHSLIQQEARNVSLLTEQLDEFSNSLEVNLSNLTRVISCGCGNGCI